MMLLERSYLKKDSPLKKLNSITTANNFLSNIDGRAMVNKSMTTFLKIQFLSSINGKMMAQICREVCLMKLLIKINSENQRILRSISRSQ